jgi:hypothetical protein
MHQRPTIPFAEIGPHLPVQLVIIEQFVQLFEHWIDLRRQLGHPCCHIFSRVAINQHGLSPPALSVRRPQPALTLLRPLDCMLHPVR